MPDTTLPPIAPHSPRQRLRSALCGVLALLTIAWLLSVLALLLVRNPAAPPREMAPEQVGRLLLETVPHKANWRDTLVFTLRAQDTGVQPRRGVVVWNSDRTQHQVPLTILADGKPHRYILPVGAHPQWHGTVRNVRVKFSPQAPPHLDVLHASLVQRPPWALDMALLRLLFPLLPEYPPWHQVLLLVAALLGASMALAWPGSGWRQRVGIVCIALGSAAGLGTLIAQLAILGTLLPVYAPLDEEDAALRVPAYEVSTEVNRIFISLAAQLPDAPVLMVDTPAAGYEVWRARYLFYPRRVDVMRGRRQLTHYQRELEQGYGAVILSRAAEAPPLPGWQHLTAADAPLDVWRAPDMPTRAPPGSVGRAAGWRLIGGLVLVLVAGWALAKLSGWRGSERLLVAWPLGTTLLAWWMFGMAVAHIPWTIGTIGVSLAATSIALLLLARLLHRPGAQPALHPPSLRISRVWVGGAIIALLLCCVTLQALLLPFTDQDTWTNWGFKARAFFLDGAMRPALTIYGAMDLHHADYPPAQPLLKAWGYLTLGGLNERLVKLIFPIWYASCVGLVWVGCRQWHTATTAMLWTLLVATTPLLLDHATIGNADLAFTTALLAGVLALCRWIEQGTAQWLAAGTLALGSAAWLKLDGLYLGIGVLVAAALVRSVMLVRRQQQRPWSTVLAAAVAVAALVAVTLPWTFFVRSLDLVSASGTLNVQRALGFETFWRGVAVTGEELLLSHNNAAWGLLGSGYGALWLVSLLALVAGWRAFRHDALLWFLVLTVAGGGVFYLLLYTMRPFYSIERYLMHIAPMAVLAAARAWQSLQGTASEEHTGQWPGLEHDTTG